MHKRLVLIAASLIAMGAAAGVASAEEGEALPHSGADINDVESLQRGARNFMNYCSGCHSLKYVRYNRIAKDLEIPDAELRNLMFTSDKPFDTINSAMPADAEGWFGKLPPDLSLMARARSVDYIYAFLKGFYVDKTRPWGTNNLILPGAAMPDVLADLQGLQKPVFKNEPDEHGSANMVLVGVESMTAGALKPEEYDRFVRDTANFLDYAGEPVKAKRQSLGIFVMLFLVVFFAFAYMLKKEYWKDVH
ncbi:MAG TPA: cytochrome c1 [Steroidobacteraceae bacterium]|jgi:ubiquinol-cytochrome c reductase cytochrome c1 subunit